MMEEWVSSTTTMIILERINITQFFRLCTNGSKRGRQGGKAGRRFIAVIVVVVVVVVVVVGIGVVVAIVVDAAVVVAGENLSARENVWFWRLHLLQ